MTSAWEGTTEARRYVMDMTGGPSLALGRSAVSESRSRATSIGQPDLLNGTPRTMYPFIVLRAGLGWGRPAQLLDAACRLVHTHRLTWGPMDGIMEDNPPSVVSQNGREAQLLLEGSS